MFQTKRRPTFTDHQDNGGCRDQGMNVQIAQQGWKVPVPRCCKDHPKQRKRWMGKNIKWLMSRKHSTFFPCLPGIYKRSAIGRPKHRTGHDDGNKDSSSSKQLLRPGLKQRWSISHLFKTGYTNRIATQLKYTKKFRFFVSIMHTKCRQMLLPFLGPYHFGECNASKREL